MERGKGRESGRDKRGGGGREVERRREGDKKGWRRGASEVGREENKNTD